MTSVIIVAAGKSRRMGDGVDKAFLHLGSKPVLTYSIVAMESCRDVDEIVLVVRKDQISATRGIVALNGCRKVKAIVNGGVNRLGSVKNGLAATSPDASVIVVHDGARPLVTPELVSKCIRSALANGSGVAASKIYDSVKVSEKGTKIEGSVERDNLWTVQTPQAFRASMLRKAIAAAPDKDAAITDEAAALERVGQEVRLVPWGFPNLKITVSDDLATAARYLQL